MCRQLKRLYAAGIIYEDGDINEDMIFEFVLPAFCNLVATVKAGVYSAKQVKNFFKECEKSGDWSSFYYFLCGYYIAVGGRTLCIEWDLIHYGLAFHAYCYYFTKMVDMLDHLLRHPATQLCKSNEEINNASQYEK